MNRGGVRRAPSKRLTNQKLYDARILLDQIRGMTLQSERNEQRFPVLLLEASINQIFFAYQSLLRELFEPFAPSVTLDLEMQGAVHCLSAQYLCDCLGASQLASPELNYIANLERAKCGLQPQEPSHKKRIDSLEDEDERLALVEHNWLLHLIEQFAKQNFQIDGAPLQNPASADTAEEKSARIAVVMVAEQASIESTTDYLFDETTVRSWYNALKNLVDNCRQVVLEW